LDKDFNELLEFYSSSEWFWITVLDTNEIEFVLKNGISLIEFGQENQGNFLLAFEFDSKKPDPPVYISDFLGNWNLYFQSFSEFVFSQIFDWQFRLDFLPDWQKDMSYYETSKLKSIKDILSLRERFKEGPSNEYIWEEYSTRVTRFYNSDFERVIVYEANDEISLEVLCINKLTTKQFFKKVKKILEIK